MTIDEVLRHLGGAYFHQDYMDEGETPADIVIDFGTETELGAVRLLHGWLQAKIGSGLSEGESKQIWMKQVHSMYDPATDGITYSQWLQQVIVLTGRALDVRRTAS